MKVTSKGQVTIPKSVRKKMGIRPGTDIYFKEENGKFFLTKNTEDKLSHWFGVIQDKDPDFGQRCGGAWVQR